MVNVGERALLATLVVLLECGANHLPNGGRIACHAMSSGVRIARLHLHRK